MPIPATQSQTPPTPSLPIEEGCLKINDKLYKVTLHYADGTEKTLTPDDANFQDVVQRVYALLQLHGPLKDFKSATFTSKGMCLNNNKEVEKLPPQKQRLYTTIYSPLGEMLKVKVEQKVKVERRQDPAPLQPTHVEDVEDPVDENETKE